MRQQDGRPRTSFNLVMNGAGWILSVKGKIKKVAFGLRGKHVVLPSYPHSAHRGSGSTRNGLVVQRATVPNATPGMTHAT
jgi:hypothetical protein